MQDIGIIVHYPEDERKQMELRKKVSAVHAQTVVERLKAMSCPLEQKAELIAAVKRIHKESGET